MNTLPAVHYLVEAEESGDRWIEAPVVIEPGRTTRLHLDQHWILSPATPRSEIVSAPDGYPVGWSAALTTKLGMN